MIAFLEAKRAGLFTRHQMFSDAVAGLIVGVVALPLAMAFAIASGAKPEQGIYTAIVAGIAVSLFGGSRVQVAGPTGAFIAILAGIAAKFGIDGLQLATLMAGIMLIVAGKMRLGSLIRFIPVPVTVGFTAGIAVIIWVGQWSAFFGLPPTPSAAHFHQTLSVLLRALPAFDVATTAMALLSLALVVATPRVAARVPGPLVALLVATALQSYFHFASIATIGKVFGEIPAHLPSLQWPHIGFARALDLLGPAAAIAMLGAIESLLSAVVADGMAGTRHDSNQELIGQGIANVLTPLFGGFAATGAIARTATGIRNGARTPLTGIVHAFVLILILLVLAPLAANIPLACLAAILFVVAYNMSEGRYFIELVRRAPRNDVAVLVTTFLLTVFTDLVVAVNIGVMLAALLFMRRVAQSVQIESATDAAAASATPIDTLPREIAVYSIDGPFFFGAAEKFQQTLTQIHTDVSTLVLRMRGVPFIDATGIHTLHKIVKQLRKRGTRVLLCETNTIVAEKLRRADILSILGNMDAGYTDVRAPFDACLQVVLQANADAKGNRS